MKICLFLKLHTFYTCRPVTGTDLRTHYRGRYLEALQPVLSSLLLHPASPPPPTTTTASSRSSENIRAATATACSPPPPVASGGESGRSQSKSLPATPKHRAARGGVDFLLSSASPPATDFPEHCQLFDGHMKVRKVILVYLLFFQLSFFLFSFILSLS